MVEPVSIAVHAVQRTTIAPGSTAVVIGSGMIGLLVIQALRWAGAKNVVAVDLADNRLELARQLGATHTINSGRTDAAAEVVYLRSDQHTYVPASGPLPAPDTSTSFLLIEYSEAPSRCYRVVAHNAAGDAAPSPVACASPP